MFLCRCGAPAAQGGCLSPDREMGFTSWSCRPWCLLCASQSPNTLAGPTSFSATTRAPTALRSAVRARRRWASSSNLSYGGWRLSRTSQFGSNGRLARSMYQTNHPAGVEGSPCNDFAKKLQNSPTPQLLASSLSSKETLCNMGLRPLAGLNAHRGRPVHDIATIRSVFSGAIFKFSRIYPF